MDVAGAQLFASDEWLAESTAWIGEVADELGITLFGRVERARVCPWSAQLVVASSKGKLWFKASCPAFAFEPELVRALHAIAPDSVSEPIAIDPRRGAMITLDEGPVMGDDRPPTTGDWQVVVCQMAELQRATADHREDLLDTGLPNCEPSTVAQRFDDLIETYACAPTDHGSHIDRSTYAKLLAARPQIVDAMALLSSARPVATLQHGDLHPWNVFATPRRGRHVTVFDFGDAQWAHPFEVLAVPLGHISSAPDVRWPDVLHAYRDAWSDMVTPREFDEILNATHLTHPVNRAFTWSSILADMAEDDLRTWGSAPLDHLRNLLAEPA